MFQKLNVSRHLALTLTLIAGAFVAAFPQDAFAGPRLSCERLTTLAERICASPRTPASYCARALKSAVTACSTNNEALCTLCEIANDEINVCNTGDPIACGQLASIVFECVSRALDGTLVCPSECPDGADFCDIAQPIE